MSQGFYGFPNILGLLRATTVKVLGQAGATAGATLAGGTTSGAPASGTFEAGALVVGQDGSLWVCSAAGSPGTWVQASLPTGATDGQLLIGRSSDHTLNLATLTAGTGLSVSNAGSSITLATTGGGGGGGALPGFLTFTVPPVVSAWTWVNQGTATATDTNSMVALAGPAVSGDNWRLLVKSAPATPYTITAALLPYAGRTGLFGLFFRESSSGKLAYIGYGDGVTATDLQVVKFTNPTTFSAAYVTVGSGSNHVWASTPVWLRIADNGTSRISSLSGDGVTWVQIHSVGRTDFLTADQVGVGLDVNNATYTGALSLASWAVT